MVESAFHYRGNVTIVRHDGAVTGYVFNRNASAPEPSLQYLDEAGGGPFTLPYAAIRTIHFTGKDMAAGKSYAAWLQRKAEGRKAGERQRAHEAAATPRPL